MSRSTETLMAGLVEDLEPVSTLHPRLGIARVTGAGLVGVLGLLALLGLRHDLVAGQPDAMLLLPGGLFFVLALASAWSAIDMARPFVGTRREGWGWSALMAAVLPFSALATIASDWLAGRGVALDHEGIECLILGLLAGLATAIVLVLWLRRGAPTDPARAGLLTGTAAGAAGMFAISLACPHNDLAHIGLWHGIGVILSAGLGRMIVPRLIRW